MVYKALSIALILVGLAHSSFSQKYDILSKVVIAQRDSLKLTEGDYQKSLRFTEWLLDDRISPEEVIEDRYEFINEFEIDPSGSIQEIGQIDLSMQQVHFTPHVVSVALIRSTILSQIHALIKREDPDHNFLKLVAKYNPVLANSSERNLIYTEKDFLALIELLEFEARLQGDEISFSAEEKIKLKSYYVSKFNQGNNQTKQLLSSAGISKEFIIRSYAKMTTEQQNKFKAEALEQSFQLYGSDPGSSVEITAESSIKKWPAAIKSVEDKKSYLKKKRLTIPIITSDGNLIHELMSNNQAMLMNILDSMGYGYKYWQTEYK